MNIEHEQKQREMLLCLEEQGLVSLEVVNVFYENRKKSLTDYALWLSVRDFLIEEVNFLIEQNEY